MNEAALVSAVPRPVVDIARRLIEAGYETWCVGGAVRDALLGIPHLDWDLATAATPDVVRKSFKRTIPVGIQFGTVGVLDRQGRMHEVTTFRRDVRTDGRHAEVEFGASLTEDLARRDFTINAIALHPLTGEVQDPFHGRDDLRARLVRAVGVADERMREDRLRALRAIRFAARFDFEIEQSTWNAILSSIPHLQRLSAERVKQELEKSVEQVVKPSRAFARWRDSGAFGALIPALASVSDVTLASCDLVSMPGPPPRTHRRLVRIAALCSELDYRSAERALKSLRFSNQDVSWISTLVDKWRQHGQPMARALSSGEPSDRDVRQWVASIGRLRVGAFMRLAAARWAAECQAGQHAPTASATRNVYRRMLRIAFRDPIAVADLAVDGDDLRAAGIPPGPHLGRILARLLDIVLEDPVHNQRDQLIEHARMLWQEEAG